MIKGAFEEVLRRFGKSLGVMGLADVALPRQHALLALEVAVDEQLAILGGDAYREKSGELVGTFDSWHSDRRSQESWAEYVTRSAGEARRFIEAYPSDVYRAWFVLVTEGDPSLEPVH